MKNGIQASREFVLEQARLNIAKVQSEPGYVKQAQQVNASLASIVAMERNVVMMAALQRSRRGEELPALPDHG